MSKMIQIDTSLYEDLCSFFELRADELSDDERADLWFRIQAQLQLKDQKLLAREAYTQYKTAQGSQEREKGRQAYLDTKGISKSHRWSLEYDNTR